MAALAAMAAMAMVMTVIIIPVPFLEGRAQLLKSSFFAFLGADANQL